MNLNIRERGNLLQICIPTGGCRLGNCIFCNYGKSVLPDMEELKNEMIAILNKNLDKKVILLNAMGSILDEKEIPFSYVETICSILKNYNFPNIVFETHYTTITDLVCYKLKTMLPDKNLYVELGLESIHSESQNYIHKKIDLNLLNKKIQILKKYNFQLEGNVFLGIPFLSMEDRIQDTVDTICYALEYGFDEVVLFPCNLKQGTELYNLYSEGKYEPVSHLEVLHCLNKLPSDLLERVSISWYGDWIQLNENGKQVNLFPFLSNDDSILSEETKSVLMNLYSSFYEEYLYSCSRKELVINYIKRIEHLFNKF